MIPISVKSCLAACVFACFAPTAATAQQAFEVIPTVSIPRENYNTWSLFLVCNPAWIVQNGDNGIAELFNQYRAFGRSIGDKNLAIWFWKQPAVKPTADNTDINRSGNYCERFKLLP